ncbi:glycosyltransferase family 2 protein [Streptococcus suis]
MKDEYLVSVIVPVYNVEKYLGKCLQSICNQSYQNLEIILINDGSTDQSGLICEDFARKDERITLVNKINGGLSSARNEGLRLFTGDFVTFIDSDDWIASDYIESLLCAFAENSDSDIVQCGMAWVTESGKILTSPSHEQKTLSGTEAILNSFFITGEFITTAQAKLYKKDFIKDLFFMDGRNNEDTIFVADYLEKVAKVVILSGYKYYYLFNPNSITNSSLTEKKVQDAFFSADYLLKKCEKCFPNYSRCMHRNICLLSSNLYCQSVGNSALEKEIINRFNLSFSIIKFDYTIGVSAHFRLRCFKYFRTIYKMIYRLRKKKQK